MVVIKFTNLRDFNQIKRSKSQYAEAPKAEPPARTRNILTDSLRCGVFSTLRMGSSKNGEKTVRMLKTPTTVMKVTVFVNVTADLSLRDMTNEAA